MPTAIHGGHHAHADHDGAGGRGGGPSRFEKTGYKPMEVRGPMTLAAVNEPMVARRSLQVFSPPQPGEPWEDHLGNLYQPVGRSTMSVPDL